MVANAIPGTKGFVSIPWEDRFWAKVEKTESCWNWAGSKDGFGYGFLFKDGRSHRVHRLSYELAKGPIPTGTEMDHLCRNKSCVNPDHLEAVTHQENIRRIPNDQRGHPPRTHCKHGHEYTEANTYRNGGTRYCRTCLANNEKARRLRKAAALTTTKIEKDAF